MGLEKERRFRLKGQIPTECVTDSVDILQIYTNSNPSATPYNRIRKTVGEEFTIYTHCTKYKLQNDYKEEVEYEITENQYLRIEKLVGKKPISKKRVFVTLPREEDCDNCIQRVAEVDFYEDGEVIIEVEFYEDEEMTSFIAPDWFGQEILSSTSYSFIQFSNLNKKKEDSIWN